VIPFSRKKKISITMYGAVAMAEEALRFSQASFSIYVTTLPLVIHKRLMVVSPALSLAAHG
jgi:hypothetical protein